MSDQLDFLRQVTPIGPPYWGGSGFWCCPRCWQSEKRQFGYLSSLTFWPDGKYKVGRCSCGYCARFEYKMGVDRQTGQREVLEFGENP